MSGRPRLLHTLPHSRASMLLPSPPDTLDGHPFSMSPARFGAAWDLVRLRRPRPRPAAQSTGRGREWRSGRGRGLGLFSGAGPFGA